MPKYKVSIEIVGILEEGKRPIGHMHACIRNCFAKHNHSKDFAHNLFLENR